MPRVRDVRSLKRQWRDGDGVVHEVLGHAKLRFDKQTRLKCWGLTPTRWHATRDAPTCLACVAYVPLPPIRIN